MIKHLPEGLVPFEDSGFAREPELPLVGQPVTVFCRVDDQACAPALHWQVAGAAQRAIEGVSTDGRHYAFSLGSFDEPCHIQYAISTNHEKTRAFAFDVCAEHTLSAPQSLYAEEHSVLAVFCDDFAIRVTREEQGFSFRALRAFSIAGRAAENAFLSHGDTLLKVDKFPFFWSLKRFGSCLASAQAIVLIRNAMGQIVAIRNGFGLSGARRFGLGERFDGVDQQGRSLHGMVVEKFTHQAEQSYLPVPFLFTESGLGWCRLGSIPAQMRLGITATLCQQVEQAPLLWEDRLFLGEPSAILAQYMALTGTPKLPPDWVFGVWISGNGWNSDAEVQAQLDALKEHAYPASAMVLEAWSDEQTFHQWNDTAHWRDPAALVRKIRGAGLHLVLWQIPVIKHEWKVEASPALLQDEAEAIERRYCVQNADGSPYRITEKWFHNSLLMDFTNPQAVQWWFSKRRYLLDIGVEGFKTDGGEFLFDKTAVLHDGRTGLSARNLYPNQYARAYHDFMEAHGLPGVTFSRAGFSGAQQTPLHWAGDQTSEWPELAAQLSAGLSAGLSGILFWGFDIGGFAGPLPTAELYLRATAMACFCPIMQWHSEPRSGQFYASHEEGFNNDRSPWNLARQLGDPSVLEIARAYARLRYRMMPYILSEAKVCVAAPRPMMAHLCFDFPGDERVWDIHDAYMFGRSLLVAPIISAGETARDVYLPRGQWRDFFSDGVYTGEQTVHVACPLDRIAVFERQGS